MIKQRKNKLSFGRDKRKTRPSPHLIKPKLTRKERDWDPRIRLNCKSAEFTDIDGIDFFYAVFHHDIKNKDKLKDIIDVINRHNDDDSEKMITGEIILRFTPILYKLTQQMIQENTKEYRKFQRNTNYLNRKDFKKWWIEAHQSRESYGIGKVIINLRKFWAVFFSSFGTFKNFQEFERRILGRDKLSIHYTDYVKRLSDYGVPKLIDPYAITSTHHDNNLRTFTDFSVFSELWRLNKAIFCTYRTLFIECTSGIKESDQCPFNNWKDFNFQKISERQLEDISEYIGDLVIGNDRKSIIGYINTGYDWADDEIERLNEETYPTDRARLLRRSIKAAEDSYHSHSNDGSSRHTHSTNPAHTSSRDAIAQKLRTDAAVFKAHNRLYGINAGVVPSDHDLPYVLSGSAEKTKELKELIKKS